MEDFSINVYLPAFLHFLAFAQALGCGHPLQGLNVGGFFLEAVFFFAEDFFIVLP
jgi:hypothetical protein